MTDQQERLVREALVSARRAVDVALALFDSTPDEPQVDAVPPSVDSRTETTSRPAANMGAFGGLVDAEDCPHPSPARQNLGGFGTTAQGWRCSRCGRIGGA